MREDFEVSQFHQRAQQSLRANLRLGLTHAKSALVISTLMGGGTAAMYYLGTLHVLAGTLTLGSLIVFSAYLVMLYQPLEALTYTAWAMEGATAGARRCFEVLDREDDVRDSPDAVAISSTRAGIAFEKVSFAYDEQHPILHDIDLQIPPNQILALVGGTGAGKSTLLSLVPRFYDPNAGVVRLDGRDVRQITKKSLRAQIAIVLQDTILFSTTVRENIAYGRPGATEAEIREAARRAQADDFICRMPDGYDSTVGERGGHLSVGQRQRLGIARAFLKNAPILLLDEPTSALDPTTEAAIMETIKELMHGRTTLIVTHRLATIRQCRSNRRPRTRPDRGTRPRQRTRGAARRVCEALRRRQVSNPMSNVNSDRRVEHDWWAEPIPPTVQFGAGFYCETAQIFRFVRNRQEDAVRLGDYVSCYAGCSFSLGKSGRCIVGDFTLMNGAIVMAEELIEIGSYCLISWNVGIAGFRFSSDRSEAEAVDAMALAPFYKERPRGRRSAPRRSGSPTTSGSGWARSF